MGAAGAVYVGALAILSWNQLPSGEDGGAAWALLSHLHLNRTWLPTAGSTPDLVSALLRPSAGLRSAILLPVTSLRLLLPVATLRRATLRPSTALRRWVPLSIVAP